MKTNKMNKMSGNELIIYRLGEMQNTLGNLEVKIDNYQSNTDKRLKDLEIYQAAQVIINQATPKTTVDWQKIVLAAFTLISGVVAAAFAFNRGGV